MTDSDQRDVIDRILDLAEQNPIIAAGVLFYAASMVLHQFVTPFLRDEDNAAKTAAAVEKAITPAPDLTPVLLALLEELRQERETRQQLMQAIDELTRKHDAAE